MDGEPILWLNNLENCKCVWSMWVYSSGGFRPEHISHMAHCATPKFLALFRYIRACDELQQCFEEIRYFCTIPWWPGTHCSSKVFVVVSLECKNAVPYQFLVYLILYCNATRAASELIRNFMLTRQSSRDFCLKDYTIQTSKHMFLGFFNRIWKILKFEFFILTWIWSESFLCTSSTGTMTLPGCLPPVCS